MVKYKRNTSDSIKKKIKENRKTRRNTNRKNITKNNSSQKKRISSKNKRKKDDISRKSNSSKYLRPADIIENEKKEVLLPRELLAKAKEQLNKNPSASELLESMKIYDINDQINFNYLKSCGKINSENYKYIYTLNYNNRKKIMKQYKIDSQILNKSSKIIFFEFLLFLINIFEPNDKTSKSKLKNYNLKYFEKFIIPISEGTKELKYYYFISIIYNWFQNEAEYHI